MWKVLPDVTQYQDKHLTYMWASVISLHVRDQIKTNEGCMYKIWNLKCVANVNYRDHSYFLQTKKLLKCQRVN